MNKQLEDGPLFGGLSGATLGVEQFEICEGLIVRQTYAHVMSPYILAFHRPKRTDGHHPGPWKTTRGGMWIDVEIEIELKEAVQPTSFDRVNTLWWALALLRLSTGAKLRMPVVSNTSFTSIARSATEPTLWPIETLPSQFLTVPDPPRAIGQEDLVWVREAFFSGSLLMKVQAFGRSFQTFDQAIWAHSPGSAIIVIWAALETLIQPGKNHVTKKLASSLSVLLEQSGASRDRLFQRVSSLYNARGSSAHASLSPTSEQLMSSFDIARRSFIACIDNHKIPNFAELQDMWQLRR